MKSENLKDSEDKGYRYLSEQVTYGGIEQRWLIVESEERKKSDLKKIQGKRISESIVGHRFPKRKTGENS